MASTAMDTTMKRVWNQLSQMDGRLDQMEQRLTDALTGRCGELEQCLADAKQKVEARVISLEMDQAQIEGWRPEVDKCLDNIALELNRANKFMERETLAANSTKLSLIPPSLSVFGQPFAKHTFADGPIGHRLP
jgi:truncated hemoglobin YjbI